MTARFFIPILAALLALAPASATAASTADASGNSDFTSNDAAGLVNALAGTSPAASGITGCNSVGASSVGSTAAIGSTYVPVADATVELNTGSLVYLECLVRPIVDAERRTATVAYVQQDRQLLSQGRNGNPYWVRNFYGELGNVSDSAFASAYGSGLLAPLATTYGGQANLIQTALARNYQYTTQAPQYALTCPYGSGWNNVITNPTQNFSWNALFDMSYPACDPVYAYTTAQQQLASAVGAAQYQWTTQLNWNNGFYSTVDANGNVTTPGIYLEGIGAQAIGSGFNQLQNANDIGQMVGSLFAGFATHLLADAGGLANSQQYLASAVTQEGQSLTSSVVGAAMQQVTQLLSWETQYQGIEQSMAQLLNQGVGQLRGAENSCWNLIITGTSDGSSLSSSVPHVCSALPTYAGDEASCQSQSGTTLHIATSTEFSDAVFGGNNFPGIASALADNIATSSQNIAALESLQSAVQSSDATARNTALQELDQLESVNPPVFTNDANVTDAQNQLQQLQSGLTDSTAGIVPTIEKRWTGDTGQANSYGTEIYTGWDGTLPPNGTDTGWCDVNDPGTLAKWTAIWSK